MLLLLFCFQQEWPVMGTWLRNLLKQTYFYVLMIMLTIYCVNRLFSHFSYYVHNITMKLFLQRSFFNNVTLLPMSYVHIFIIILRKSIILYFIILILYQFCLFLNLILLSFSICYSCYLVSNKSDIKLNHYLTIYWNKWFAMY